MMTLTELRAAIDKCGKVCVWAEVQKGAGVYVRTSKEAVLKVCDANTGEYVARYDKFDDVLFIG